MGKKYIPKKRVSTIWDDYPKNKEQAVNATDIGIKHFKHITKVERKLSECKELRGKKIKPWQKKRYEDNINNDLSVDSLYSKQYH